MENYYDSLDPFLSIEGNRITIPKLIKQLKSQIGIVPFIGAGMSVPFRFPQWSDFLISLAHKDDIKKKVQNLISEGKYEEAAQNLLDDLRANEFQAAVDYTFGPERLPKILPKAAILHLPRLCRGPVLTTNFDQVLERAFQDAKIPFNKVILGMKTDQIANAFSGLDRVLIKLHGDATDRNDRVLTLSDYQTKYGSREPLMAVLRFAMTRPLLFLGCSLKQDRTVDVLKGFVEELRDQNAEGLQVHYAIVERPADEAEFHVRSGFLVDLGIFPIWYPTGRHELIEPLLRELAEKASIIDLEIRTVGVLPSPGSTFKDREEEYRETCELLANHRRLICIIGRAGMGKTTLVSKVLSDIKKHKWPHSIEHIPIDGIIYLSTLVNPGISFETLYEKCIDVLTDDAIKKDLKNKLLARSVELDIKITALLQVLVGGTYIVMLDHVESLLEENGAFKTEYSQLSRFIDLALQSAENMSILMTSLWEPKLDPDAYQFKRTLPLEKGLPPKDAIAMLREMDVKKLREATDDQLKHIVEHTEGLPWALRRVEVILNGQQRMSLDDICHQFQETEEVINYLAKEANKSVDVTSREILEALAVYGIEMQQDALEFFQPEESQVNRFKKALTRLEKIGYLKFNEVNKRYSLHSLDRVYAYQKIPYDRRKTMHLQAADYFAKIRKPAAEWKTIDDMMIILHEYDHRITASDFEGAVNLMDQVDYSIRNHHKFRAHLLMRGFGDQVVSRRMKLIGKVVPSIEVRNLGALGWICRRLNRTTESVSALRKANELSTSTNFDDPEARMFILTEDAFVKIDKAATHNEAIEKLKDLYSMATGQPDKQYQYWEGMALLGLAYASMDSDRNEEALSYAQDCRVLFQNVGDPYRELDAVVRLSMIYRKMMKYEKAIQVCKEGLEIARIAKIANWQGELYSQLGFHERGTGRYTNAITAHSNSKKQFGKISGNRREEAVQLIYIGNLLLDLGRVNWAIRTYNRASEIAASIGIQHERTWCLAGLGIAYTQIGDYKEALRCHRDALQKVETNPKSRLLRLTDLAETCLKAGFYDEAKTQLLGALNQAAIIYNKPSIAELPEAYLTAHPAEDALPHEMQSVGDHQRRGILLTRLYLHSGDLDNSLKVIQKTREHEVLPHRHFTAMLHGLILARIGDSPGASDQFGTAVSFAHDIIAATPRCFDAWFSQGLAQAGLSLLVNASERENLELNTKRSFLQGRKLCSERGVLDDVLRLFKYLPPERNPSLEQLLY